MNNELERILGEVADGASRRTDDLPVAALRGRGVRRRRTRQATYGVVGVAAAFGVAFSATQVLPGGGLLGPAASPGSPTLDRPALLGACGSNVANLPVIDASYWIDMDPVNLRVAEAERLPLTMTLPNYGPSPLDLGESSRAYLMVVEDDVVVGFAWQSDDSTLPIVAAGESLELSGFAHAVRCVGGEGVPTGSPGARDALPPGDYETFAMIGRPGDEAATEWAFDMVGRRGTLTILDGGPATAPEPGETSAGPDLGELQAVEVNLPVCGEAIAGFQFPARVDVASSVPLEVTVGHTGEDENGEPFFFGDGYGDQLQVSLGAVNNIGDLASAREVDAAVVVARDGVVVAEMRWPAWSDVTWNVWPLTESRSFTPTEDWVDCASGEHTRVFKGEYEILGWRTIEVTAEDGSAGVLTVGYEPVTFTAYDFEDPDNPGPSND